MAPQLEVTLAEALARYLQAQAQGAGLQQEFQQELFNFVRHCGRDAHFAKLTALDIEEYTQGIASGSANEGAGRLQGLRDFLQFVRQQGFVRVNLAAHVKVRRPTKKLRQRAPGSPGETEAIHLTDQGLRQMQEEIARLRAEMVRVAEEIRKAAADKDVRENAPLEAAREYQGQIATRLRGLEATLKRAVALPGQGKGEPRSDVRLGSRVTLQDVVTSESLTYMLVDPREANLQAAKMSVQSPVGRALLGRREGEEVAVAAPRGVVRFRIMTVD